MSPREGGPGQGVGRRAEGGGGDRPPGAGAGRPRPERQLARTVYVLPSAGSTDAPQKAKPTPVQVKVGISDGINTEITEGLTEGRQVVIGIISTGENTAARPANPFGGGMRRF